MSERFKTGGSPFPGDSEAKDLQLEVMAAPAEPAHGLCLVLHHCIRAPACQLVSHLGILSRTDDSLLCLGRLAASVWPPTALFRHQEQRLSTAHAWKISNHNHQLVQALWQGGTTQMQSRD